MEPSAIITRALDTSLRLDGDACRHLSPRDGRDDESGTTVMPTPSFVTPSEMDDNIGPGDPAVDPTADADGCLNNVVANSGTM